MTDIIDKNLRITFEKLQGLEDSLVFGIPAIIAEDVVDVLKEDHDARVAADFADVPSITDQMQ